MTDEELREVLEGEFEKIGMVNMSARIRGELPSMPGEDAKISAAISAMSRVAAQVRAQIAQWMITHSYATGHGDTIEDLLSELIGQVRAETVGECANVADGWLRQYGDRNPQFIGSGDFACGAVMDIADAIRALLNKDGVA